MGENTSKQLRDERSCRFSGWVLDRASVEQLREEAQEFTSQLCDKLSSGSLSLSGIRL